MFAQKYAFYAGMLCTVSGYQRCCGRIVRRQVGLTPGVLGDADLVSAVCVTNQGRWVCHCQDNVNC